MAFQAREASPTAVREQPEVVFVQHGEATAMVGGESIPLRRGDTMTVPTGLERAYWTADDGAEVIVVRGTA